MDPESNKKCIAHVRHCIAYKKIIMKVIDTLYLPLVLDKYIFTYVGFFPLLFEKQKVVRPLRVYAELEEP